VAENLPFSYTGADFYALCSDAMLKAVTRQAARVDAKIKAINASPETRHTISTAYFFDHYATAEDIAVMVTERDFMDAHRELIPSVSAGELAHYERVRAAFEGGREKQARQYTAAPSLGPRRMSAASKTSSKGKGKAVAGKGKGKAVALDSDDEYNDSWEDAKPMNGGPGIRGKAVAAFHDGTASDDEGLYD
jgi:peroxin-6